MKTVNPPLQTRMNLETLIKIGLYWWSMRWSNFVRVIARIVADVLNNPYRKRKSSGTNCRLPAAKPLGIGVNYRESGADEHDGRELRVTMLYFTGSSMTPRSIASSLPASSSSGLVFRETCGERSNRKSLSRNCSPAEKWPG
jgi:hypothetical protein